VLHPIPSRHEGAHPLCARRLHQFFPIRCRVGEGVKEREANVTRPGDTRQHASPYCVGPTAHALSSLLAGAERPTSRSMAAERSSGRRIRESSGDGGRRTTSPPPLRTREHGRRRRRLGERDRLAAWYDDGVLPPSSVDTWQARRKGFEQPWYRAVPIISVTPQHSRRSSVLAGFGLVTARSFPLQAVPCAR
jgi:hypothetical protein